MANEISAGISLSVKAANKPYTSITKRSTFDMSGTRRGPGIVNIGTSDEAIGFGDIATLGWCYFENLDATNYVEIGPDSGGSIVKCMRLNAGEFGLIRLAQGITLRAQANTAAVDVDIQCLEN